MNLGDNSLLFIISINSGVEFSIQIFVDEVVHHYVTLYIDSIYIYYID